MHDFLMLKKGEKSKKCVLMVSAFFEAGCEMYGIVREFVCFDNRKLKYM